MSILLVSEIIFGLIIGNGIVAVEGRWKLWSFLISLAIAIAIAIAIGVGLLLAGHGFKRRS